MTDIAARLQPFGETVFATWSRLAIEHDAINLGQGFPDFDGPPEVIEAAHEAMLSGCNQYAPMPGILPLREAIASDAQSTLGRTLDPDQEITVTSGCTEGIAATMLGLLNPGDEVIVFEPFYDSYPATIAMAGGVMVPITTRPPDFGIDLEMVRGAITPRTRAILLNSPHNPTGHVASDEALEGLAALCIANNLILISDEVYDRMVYEGHHRSMASLDGMGDRTIVLRSLAKTWSLTGWKIGWVIAPPALTDAVRAAHQFLTYAVPTPLQHGAVRALSMGAPYYQSLHEGYLHRRNMLCGALEEVGFVVSRPAGSYFVMCDHRPFGFPSSEAFCLHLAREIGVVGIPPTSFYVNPADGDHLVRFAFCKTTEVLQEAMTRLALLGEGVTRR